MPLGVYFGGQIVFDSYFGFWGAKLVKLEKQGLLSKEFGAAWDDVIAENAMETQARQITNKELELKHDSILKINGIAKNDYASLSIIAKLNAVNRYANTIKITDCQDRLIAAIRTNHNRANTNDFPPVLIAALIASEDRNFHDNKLGIEYDSFIRATLRSLWDSIIHFRLVAPRGTSTITQQVAKLFLSRLDVSGRRQSNHSLDRKFHEMRLASAIRLLYSDDEIIEVYVNHCITSDYGLMGIKDIAWGLFGKELSQLTDAESVYIARMVKWGRNVPQKIRRQCNIDMPRISKAMHWDIKKQRDVLFAIDNLTFRKPSWVNTNYGPLVDLANEYWLLILRRKGVSESHIAEMDLINPNSLIRKKGTCTIKLNVDLPLQKEIERMVDRRGYGKDTTIITDVRIGSSGKNIFSFKRRPDTLYTISVLDNPSEFSEQGSSYKVKLLAGDTLITNVRYKKLGLGRYHRSCYYYTHRSTTGRGQYFAYAAIDSKSGKLLAYYSRDKLGSRLTCLLKNHLPNGSSTAKPIFNALNFDWGTFKPFDTWNDSLEVTDNVPWKRTFEKQNGKTIGVIFANSAVRNVGYEVHNHLFVFEGCKFIFDQLAASNNILGVENVYRLNRTLLDSSGQLNPDAMDMAQFLYRIGDYQRIVNDYRMATVTGVRVYKELARIAGVNIDSVNSGASRIPVSDSMYSVGLGTLELTLYEQLHLYNMLYNNDLIERPAGHPSLVIESVLLDGDTVVVDDTLRHVHPFADLNNARPTLLGMHKRLVSNPADGLEGFDVSDSALPLFYSKDEEFDKNKLTVNQPVSNFAKSGTTDDVIRPFNVGNESGKRTNYGLWNAVLRLDFAKLSTDSSDNGVRDVTLACIGECNQKLTGDRDGKTLHKFVSIGLLKKAGVPCNDGFFHRYEAYLKSIPRDSNKTCGNEVGKITEAQE